MKYSQVRSLLLQLVFLRSNIRGYHTVHIIIRVAYNAPASTFQKINRVSVFGRKVHNVQQLNTATKHLCFYIVSLSVHITYHLGNTKMLPIIFFNSGVAWVTSYTLCLYSDLLLIMN